MANTYKILGQVSPAATTETDLYTVPGATSAVVSSIVVCNRENQVATFNISISQGGSATAVKDYIYYSVVIPSNDTFVASIGITLATTDVVRVYGSNGLLSFSLFGSEIT